MSLALSLFSSWLQAQLAPAATTSSALLPGVPIVYEHSRDAGPGQSFFLVGDNLTTNLNVLGVSADDPQGAVVQPKIQFLTEGYLAATMPESAQDGVFLVKVQNANGFSNPIVLNAPELWWCHPNPAAPGDVVRAFGRNLARRPDFAQAAVFMSQPRGEGGWLEVMSPGKYVVTFRVPAGLKGGTYELRVHAGTGDNWGWSRGVMLTVESDEVDVEDEEQTKPLGPATFPLAGTVGGLEIQRALDGMARQGGGIVQLPAGQFLFSGTLRIPAQVTLAGRGLSLTKLQVRNDPSAHFARLTGPGWNQAPARIHTAGDTMEYQLDIPKTGLWDVWVRYATDMRPWGQPGVSGSAGVSVDDDFPMLMQDLPNTGGFDVYRWSKTATLQLSAGRRRFFWKNLKGGGISLDAFVFTQDRKHTPTDDPFPVTTTNLVVLQGEDCARFDTKEGALPGGDHAALWLQGHGAGVSNLTVLGNAQVNVGIFAGASDPTTWLTNCVVERVGVADCDGKERENCALLVRNVHRARVIDNELWGRAPIFLRGARQSIFARNRLVPVTRFGGNAEAAILARNEPVEECLIDSNRVASPPGAESGGPTVRRLIWISTGHGSITHNWIANNGVEPARGPGASAGAGAGTARFGGVAGTDQNVGEMILFEGQHRTAYFGPPVRADNQSLTLPASLPSTPDDQLGHLTREELASNDQGSETPFWPPDVDDGSPEPPLGEYYVSVLSGRGQGQTRRIVKRIRETLFLDRPWAVPPNRDSRVSLSTAFYQNLIVGNHASDGMTGIQLWIACIENVISGNTIARQRKPGLFLYANATTLASSMPRTWNRGISPLFWNFIEGNRVDECSAGVLVTSGDAENLPIEFPRALGNVIRHNSFVRSRTDGVVLSSRPPSSQVLDTSASIIGTLVEFNVVRDARVAYHAGPGTDATVFHRNHAYFWYPVSLDSGPPVAFQIDQANTTVVRDDNRVEGAQGETDNRIIDTRILEEVPGR